MNIQAKIRKFYDDSSSLWEKTWGEHMHHGYYGRAGNYKIERRQAQVDLIEELLAWGLASRTQDLSHASILDVGCGIGGSTLYLAQKLTATATGITLSPVQAARAKERAQEAGLDSRVDFRVADALEMPFEDNSFDLIWSLESGEHMPDKEKFLQECHRVLKPGGSLIMATWCHRSTNSLAGDLTAAEKRHLEQVYQVYCLPYVISLTEYAEIACRCGFENLRTDDWSTAVAPFWDTVIGSAFEPEALMGLLKSGWGTIQAALSLGLMSSGYERGLIRFGLLSGSKALKVAKS